MRREASALLESTDLESPDFDLGDLEARYRRTALKAFSAALQGRINGRPLLLPKGARCGHCGVGTLRRNGFRPKTVTTTLGSMRLQRAHYVCDHAECGTGTYPLDLKLDLGRGRWSQELLRVLGEVGQHISFGPSAELLRDLLGVVVSGRHLGRVVRREGEAMEADRQGREPQPPARVEPVMHCSVDGTAAPMKPSQVQGRRGRGEDGKARSREAKLLSFHRAELQPDGTFRMHGKTVCGAIESAASPGTSLEPAAFTRRLGWRGVQSGFDQAAIQVVVADGAPWIWNVVEERFPRAVQILDVYHVKARLVEVALARRGGKAATAERREQWVESRLAALKRGRLNQVIAELERDQGCTAAQDCARYFRNNRSRMDYPRYRRNGWCCSSAVIESVCKSIVGGRIKGSGPALERRGRQRHDRPALRPRQRRGGGALRTAAPGQHPAVRTPQQRAESTRSETPRSLAAVGAQQKCPTHLLDANHPSRFLYSYT